MISPKRIYTRGPNKPGRKFKDSSDYYELKCFIEDHEHPRLNTKLIESLLREELEAYFKLYYFEVKKVSKKQIKPPRKPKRGNKISHISPSN